jgi:hypothetical protein
LLNADHQERSMIILIRPQDCAAHALPAIGFRVDTGGTGLGGRPFEQLGEYLSLCGPPGGRESFLVRPALEPESDAAAVEREVARQEGRILAEGIAEKGQVLLAGAPRPAIAYVMGEGIFRQAWCSALVGTPAGALLVEVGIGWREGAPTCADVVENPELRELVQSFALLDGIRPAESGARVYPFDPDALRQFDDVLGSARQNPLSREQLLGFRPEELMGTVFDEPQPTPGIGLTRLACARQLEAHGVPQEALVRCIEAWRAARAGLDAGAVHDARLVKLDRELAEAALGAPKLGRWMAALRSHATTTRALDHACQFLDDVRTIWTDLLSHASEKAPDRASSASPAHVGEHKPTTPAAGETISRAQLLAIAPPSMMDAVFAPPDPPSDVGTAMLAFVEQLRAAKVPLEALELCIVAWSAALDGLAPGTQVPADRLAHLDASLDLQMRGFDALAKWIGALRQRVSSAETLDLAIQFLLRARTTWTLGDALRARQAGR